MDLNPPTCSHCLAQLSTRFCSCQLPPIYLCDLCFPYHFAKVTGLPHEIWPIECRQDYDQPGYKEALARRKHSIDRHISELEGSLGLIDQWKAAASEAFTDMQNSLEMHRNTLFEELERLRERVKADIEAAAKETKAAIYQFAPKLESPIATALWTAEDLGNTVFTLKTQFQDWVQKCHSLLFSLTLNLQSNIPQYIPEKTAFHPSQPQHYHTLAVYAKSPDYLSPNSRATRELLGPFQDHRDTLATVERGPVCFEDGVYVGKWNQLNQFHGYGRYMWKCGDNYEGYWDNGKMQGYGRRIYPNGDCYTGNWARGTRNGFGKLKYQKNGELYTGEFRNEDRHGFGSLLSGPNQDWLCYLGQFASNKFEGHGTYIWRDYRMSTGQWKNGQKEGKGVMVWKGGDMYFGDWANDEKNGHGRACWPSNHSYVGEWKRGKQWGWGAHISPGVPLRGNWVDGRYDG